VIHPFGSPFALALVLAAVLQDPVDPDEAGAPGPLAGSGGIAGFTSVSRIVFPDEESPPHRFEAVYLFPGRARWRLLAIGGRSSERMLVYRYGEHAHQLEPGKTGSSVFHGDSLVTTLLQVELRRAAMTWPHGFPWEGEGEARTTPITASTKSQRPIGSLAATLGKDGRPARIEALDLLGNEVESLAIDAWQELRGRWWPRTLTLSQHDRPIWKETVEKVETRVYFVDLFFQPPDRRPTLPATLASGRSVLSLDLQGITFRRRELERGCTWDEALARAAAWIEEASTREGLRLDPVPTIELAAEGRPGQVLLRLAQRDDTPPEGWTTIGDRPGLALVLDDLSQLGPPLLTALFAAAPAGAQPGTPYCRILEREGGRQVQVYLPLEGQ